MSSFKSSQAVATSELATHQEIHNLIGLVSEKEQQPPFSQVRVDRETFNILERQNGVTGLAKVELLARLAAWFDAQPSSVQQAILRRDDAAEEIWRIRQGQKVASGKPLEATAGVTDVLTAVRHIRELADRIEILERAATKKPRK